VFDLRYLSVHQTPCSHDLTAKNITNALVTKADPEERNAGSKILDNLIADSRFLWRAWTRGNANVVWLQFFDLIKRDAVIAVHLHVCTHLAEVLDEVISEGVVIVDDQQHGWLPMHVYIGKCKARRYWKLCDPVKGLRV
jgi:hypothetical protein